MLSQNYQNNLASKRDELPLMVHVLSIKYGVSMRDMWNALYEAFYEQHHINLHTMYAMYPYKVSKLDVLLEYEPLYKTFTKFFNLVLKEYLQHE